MRLNDNKKTNTAAMSASATLAGNDIEVVQSLDKTAWSDSDAESKVREKLQEFAAELQMVKMIRDAN